MKALIQRLVEAYGPSGREDEVRALIRQEIEGQAEEVKVSPMGSLHAVVNRGGGTRVMLAAHMDEIGVIVSHIDERGFARFQPIGGVNPQTLLGHRVRFANGARAVVGIEDPWQRSKPLTLERFFLDFGVDTADDCPVQVGDIGGFDRPFLDLGNRLVAKSMDDRIGVAVLIETLRQLKRPANEVQFAFTVQEEVGLRGATTSAFGLDPEVGIAVDVTATGDTPRGLKMAVELGKGPAIKVRDVRMIADPRVVEAMVGAARRARLPYQLEVLQVGSTDAAAIQLTREGVPSGTLSIPCRYVHTPSEMVDLRDVEAAVQLLVALLERPLQLEAGD